MHPLSNFANFLLSEWIWGMMFGWAYVASNALTLTFFLKHLLPTSLFKAFIMAIGANIASFLSYSMVVVIVFMHLFKWLYVPTINEIQHPLWAHLLLATIYTVLQLGYFRLLYKIYRINYIHASIAVISSALSAALLSYYYLKLTVGIIFMPR